MKDFVPSDITEMIAELEARQDERFHEKKRAEDAEAERLLRMQDLRDARAVELQAACARIGAWIERFEKTAGPAIWRFEHRLVIFTAKFWRGEPAPPDDRRTIAQLRIGPPAGKATERYAYEEVHSGVPAQSVHRTPLVTISQLWRKTHPDFVLQCDAQLSGPDAWKDIRATLERLNRAPGDRR